MLQHVNLSFTLVKSLEENISYPIPTHYSINPGGNDKIAGTPLKCGHQNSSLRILNKEINIKLVPYTNFLEIYD